MSTTAFIYPGQGSQFVGMARDLFEQSGRVRETYQQASEILGFDLAKICFEGPEEELKQTRVTQPAIFVHSAVLTDMLLEKGIKADMSGGHSLGEYSALYTAGSLSFGEALALVKIRANLMQTAGEVNPGAMAAIIGLSAADVESVCENASAAGVVKVANYNSPAQSVISGSVSGVERAMELAKEAGAKRAIPLVVSGAFHSPLMEHAREGLQEALESTDIKDAQFPVYSNVSAEPMTKAEEIRKLLLDQLTNPVRWTEIIENMTKAGASQFFEIGPGKVLTGLLKRISPDAAGTALEKFEQVVSFGAESS